MKILVTGAKGFIAKNLLAELLNKKYENIETLCVDKETPINLLDDYCSKCDFVIHLAGINRPLKEEEFMTGNFGFTSKLIELLSAHNNKAPFLVSSSIQAELDNPYGKSKKAMEEIIIKYGQENNVKILIYRLPNVFGKWCKPNYNSAIATFANNIANNLSIQVSDRNREMNLVYIDDVVKEFIRALNNQENRKSNFCYVEPVLHTTLGEIVDLLYSFKEYRKNLNVPNNDSLLTKYLYATYLSYLPADQMCYELDEHKDNRGSFTEFVRTFGQGQFSVNITHPGITKGNHFHHTKHEKYLVVQGKALILLRKIGEEKVYEYKVSEEKLVVVDIPVGYTHSMTNIGDNELITFIWANEPFDPDNPDTIFEEVR